MKKNIYFVQVDVSACMGAQNAYLPYTAGILVASAWQSEIVKQNYCFKEFIFLRENVDGIVARMDNPFMVGFSTYSWSTEYNKLLAKAIKEKFPDCVIVFGGHNVPDDFSFLEKYDYIDILCHGEGEDTVKYLMEALAEGKPLDGVCNISFRSADGYKRTQTKCQTTLDYPSPYLDGWFDDVIEKYPEISFNAILETSRGCPHKCAYCDWGLHSVKPRLFPFDRIEKEIKWMSDHKIAFIWGADGNFGMFDRDIEIAKALADAKRKTGYPERMRMNYSKTNFKVVFEIIKIFKEVDFDRVGATLSFQSLSPTVLENIDRKNMDFDFYRNLLAVYNKEKMKAYSELILGLPGETYESFTQGIGKLFELGQHFVFEVYSCILLPNAAIGQKEYIEKYGIKTVDLEIIRSHFANQAFEIPEYNTIVVETNTMSREMWVRSTTFYYIAKALHGNGLLRAFDIYLHYEKGVPYEKFYDGMIDYFEANPELFASKLYFEIKEHATEQSLGITNKKLFFEPCGDMVWDDNEYLVLHMISQLDRFYEDMLPYLRSFGIDEDIFADLLAYQKGILRKPGESESRAELSHDIHTYLSDVYVDNYSPLKEKKHTLVMKDSATAPDWFNYGKFVVWYGRMGWASYKDDVTEE